jgi:hypothetical protein
MTNPCNSIQILSVNPNNVAKCRGYEQEAKFVNCLQKRKRSSPRLRNAYICICDQSRSPCNALPQCHGAIQGSYNILLIDDRKKRCEAVELKLNVKSNKNVENLLSKIEKKFKYNCCSNYCTVINRVVVFPRRDILKRIKDIANKKHRLSIEVKLTSLDRLDFSILPND